MKVGRSTSSRHGLPFSGCFRRMPVHERTIDNLQEIEVISLGCTVHVW